MSHAEEQYLRSAKSSHLVANEYSTDIDSIIAAGSSGESLAASLLRLRGEYDAVRGESDQAQRNAAEHETMARNLEALALIEVAKMNRGPTRAADYRGQAAAIRKAATSRTLTDHKLIIARLKSLPIARMALYGFVLQQTSSNGMDEITWNEIDHVVRSMLQAFLVPRCGPCGGKGFTGGHRAPTVRCTTCKESGKIAIEWPSIEFEIIGRELLYQIEIRCEGLRRHIARRTRA